MLKIKVFPTVIAVAVVAAVLYTVGGIGPGVGRSHQGKVVRAEVTLTEGQFEVVLNTRSSLDGEKSWVPPGRTYTGTFSQDILLKPKERLQIWLTAATDIEREIDKRTLACQIYEDGKALPGDARDSRPIRRGNPGEPVGCRATVVSF